MGDPPTSGSRSDADRPAGPAGLPDVVPSGWTERYGDEARSTIEAHRTRPGPSGFARELVPARAAIVIVVATSLASFLVFGSLWVAFVLSPLVGTVGAAAWAGGGLLWTSRVVRSSARGQPRRPTA